MLTIITAFVCVAFILLRIPSLFEPHWYADEGIYAAVAYAMRHGQTLYTQIWDNKPPLIYYLYTAAGNIIGLKIFNLLAGLMSIIGLRALSGRVGLSTIGRTATIIVATLLLGTPLLEGNIANAENFFVPLVIWGLYFGLSAKSWDMFFSGVLFATAFMFKFHPLFDFAALFFTTILVRHSIRALLERWYAFVTGFLIPVIVLVLYLAVHGTFLQAMQIIFLGNIAYTQVYEWGLTSQPVKMGILIAVITGISILHVRKRISPMTSFLGILLGFEYFAALLSGRQYTHYLLQTVPALSLIFGYAMEHIIHHMQTIRNIIVISLLAVMLWAGMTVFDQGKGSDGSVNSIYYYSSFSQYIQGKRPYFLSDIETRITKLKEYFSTKAQEKIVMYTDNPWYYVETGVVPPLSTVSAYHQNLRPHGESLFAGELGLYSPDIIIVDKEAHVSESVGEILKKKYILDKEDRWFAYYVQKQVL